MQKGFTLIELMVTLAVLVVTLSIGVPNFSIWIKNNRINESTRTLTSALQLARSEAVSRQSVITINSGGNWTNGLTIYTDTTPGGNTPITAGDTLIKDLDFSMNGITVNSDDVNDFVSFTSSGLLNEGGAQRTFRFCQSSGETEGTSVTINSVGRAAINTIDNCP
ncbi:MAG: hypothetical protein COA46_00590 [Porticoccaceae bacterium]|nr:MAG: hypothetical protein COA46_00590 [Porticoccaceae bacterium]